MIYFIYFFRSNKKRFSKKNFFSKFLKKKMFFFFIHFITAVPTVTSVTPVTTETTFRKSLQSPLSHLSRLTVSSVKCYTWTPNLKIYLKTHNSFFWPFLLHFWIKSKCLSPIFSAYLYIELISITRTVDLADILLCYVMYIVSSTG